MSGMIVNPPPKATPHLGHVRTDKRAGRLRGSKPQKRPDQEAKPPRKSHLLPFWGAFRYLCGRRREPGFPGPSPAEEKGQHSARTNTSTIFKWRRKAKKRGRQSGPPSVFHNGFAEIDEGIETMAQPWPQSLEEAWMIKGSELEINGGEYQEEGKRGRTKAIAQKKPPDSLSRYPM